MDILSPGTLSAMNNTRIEVLLVVVVLIEIAVFYFGLRMMANAVRYATDRNANATDRTRASVEDLQRRIDHRFDAVVETLGRIDKNVDVILISSDRQQPNILMRLLGFERLRD